MGGFRVDFGWIWVGLELMCVGCAAGLSSAFMVAFGMWLHEFWSCLGLVLERCPKPPNLAHNSGRLSQKNGFHWQGN